MPITLLGHINSLQIRMLKQFETVGGPECFAHNAATQW